MLTWAILGALAWLAPTFARRWFTHRRRRLAAHRRLGRLALPPPGPTPYEEARDRYLDALDACAESRDRRRAARRALQHRRDPGQPVTMHELAERIEHPERYAPPWTAAPPLPDPPLDQAG
jgi:hypothetical protein